MIILPHVHFATTTTFACLVRHEKQNSTTTQGKLKIVGFTKENKNSAWSFSNNFLVKF